MFQKPCCGNSDFCGWHWLLPPGIRDYVGAVEDATDAIQAEGVRPEFWRRLRPKFRFDDSIHKQKPWQLGLCPRYILFMAHLMGKLEKWLFRSRRGLAKMMLEALQKSNWILIVIGTMWDNNDLGYTWVSHGIAMYSLFSNTPVWWHAGNWSRITHQPPLTTVRTLPQRICVWCFVCE